MKHLYQILVMLFALALGQASWQTALADTSQPKIRVVATIAPLAMLAEEALPISFDIKTLIDGSVSPHEFALTPSMVKQLSRAEIVLWAGPEVEHALADKLTILAPDAVILQLGEGASHFWLDPDKAADAVMRLRREFVDAQFVDTQSDAAGFEQLKTKISNTLEGTQNVPFLAMHDGYTAFSEAFGVAPLAVIGTDHDAPLSAKRVMHIRKLLAQNPNMCLFIEPQQHAHELEPILDGRQARLATLDLLGGDVPDGANRYHRFIESFALDIANCLRGTDAKQAP